MANDVSQPPGGIENITVTAPAAPTFPIKPGWGIGTLAPVVRPVAPPKPTEEVPIRPKEGPGTSEIEVREIWAKRQASNDAQWEQTRLVDELSGGVRVLATDIAGALGIVVLGISHAIGYAQDILKAEKEAMEDRLYVDEQVSKWLHSGQAFEEMSQALHDRIEQDEHVRRVTLNELMKEPVAVSAGFGHLVGGTATWIREVVRVGLAPAVLSPGALTWWNPDQVGWEQQAFPFPRYLPELGIEVATQNVPDGWYVTRINPVGRPLMQPSDVIDTLTERAPNGETEAWQDLTLRPLEEALNDLSTRLHEFPYPDPLPDVGIQFQALPDGQIEVGVAVTPKPHMAPRPVPNLDPAERELMRDQKTKSQMKYLAFVAMVNKRFGGLTEIGDFTQALLYGFTWNDSGRRVKQWKDVYRALSGTGPDVDFSVGRFAKAFLRNELTDRLIAAGKKVELDYMVKKFGRGHWSMNFYGMPSTWISRFEKLNSLDVSEYTGD